MSTGYTPTTAGGGNVPCPLGASDRTSKPEGGELDLDAIRARAEAATAGPWGPFTTGVRDGEHWYVAARGRSVANIAAYDGDNEDQRQPDAEFIAHAREDVPALVAEVELLRERLRRLEVEKDEEVGDKSRLGHAVASVWAAQAREAEAERDRARDMAVALEQENGHLAAQFMDTAAAAPLADCEHLARVAAGFERERDEAQAGAKVLGETLHLINEQIIDVTDSRDLIDADGDGDWDGVYDRLDELGAARAVVDTVRSFKVALGALSLRQKTVELQPLIDDLAHILQGDWSGALEGGGS